ncbi:MAG: hypothetical protein ACJ8C4_20195 [Gemmataceae bacterium]
MASDDRSHAWLGVVVTFLAFAVVTRVTFFAPDSWSYLELSNTVFKDFYHVNTQRQYVLDTPYGISFPPLWPVLMATARLVIDLGLYTGVALNFFICFGLLAALIRLVRVVNLPAWTGTSIYLGLLACTAFLEDAFAARNAALSILLLTLALHVVAQPGLGATSSAAAGLWMGLACLNRFDALIAAFAVGLIVTIQSPRRLASFVAYYGALSIALLPWIVYSHLQFNSFWVNDNTRQVLVARDASVMNYYQTPPQADLLTNFGNWLWGLLTNKIPMSWKGLVFCLIHSATLPLFAVVLVACGPRLKWSRPSQRLVIWGMVLAGCFIMGPTLVGYGWERYFLPVQLFVILSLMAALITATPVFWTRTRVLLLLGVLCVAVMPRETVPWLVKYREKLHSMGWFTGLRKPTAAMMQLARAVDRDAHGQWSRLLIYSPSPEGWQEWEYGALTGHSVAVMPRVKTGTFESFLRDWRITHIYDGQKVGKLVDPSVVNLVALDVPGLYRVEFRTAEK